MNLKKVTKAQLSEELENYKVDLKNMKDKCWDLENRNEQQRCIAGDKNREINSLKSEINRLVERKNLMGQLVKSIIKEKSNDMKDVMIHALDCLISDGKIDVFIIMAFLQDKETVYDKNDYDIAVKGAVEGKNIPVIKRVRELFGLGLKEAKYAVVDGADNGIVRRSVPVEEAKELKRQLEQVGGIVKLI